MKRLILLGALVLVLAACGNSEEVVKEVLVTREVEVTSVVEVTREVEVTRVVEVTKEVIVLATPTPMPVFTRTPEDTPILVPTDIPELTTTPTPEDNTYAANSNANLREGPGTGYAIVGNVAAGDRFAVSARTQDGTWFNVQTNDGKNAWIAAFLIENAPTADIVAVTTDIPPVPTPTLQPATAQSESQGTRLKIDFINPHYNCNRGNGSNDFYRYFQIDFFITNTSSETIEAKWKPTRWIIVGGDQTRSDEQMSEWINRRTGFYDQPDILPGGSDGWTYVASRIEMWEWVQAVEWEYKGQTYRQEFENNAINRSEWNYKSCP